MLEKLQAIKDKWIDLETQMSDPALIADMNKFKQVNKEYKSLKPLVKAYDEYKLVTDNIKSTKEMLDTEKDPEMKEMAKMELDELQGRKEGLDEEIKVLLIPKDPADDKNAIIEIRKGTGGDESAIFVGDLFKMYTRYCSNKKWKTEIITLNEAAVGGYSEVAFSVEGEGVYGILKYESGVHRVQRVPKTESQGRVHTSAITVAVLPEAEEVDVDINVADLKWDTFRASGAGGQHVNKTESAVRVTHIPTGVVVECQEERSQHKNRAKAMTVLRSRIYEAELEKHMAAIAAERRTLVSTGDRSAKIRTYNYPQSRVTDHRIGLTLYHLDSIVNGDLDMVIQPLQMAENAEKLKAGGME